jgi:hypothetical protein
MNTITKMSDQLADPMELWRAARQGEAQMCRDLLQRNHTNPGYINCILSDYYDHGMTALVMAIKHSRKYERYRHSGHAAAHLEVVKVLLVYGADVSVICDDGTTALHWAVKSAPTNEYMYLVLRNLPRAQVDVKVHGSTALMTAVKLKQRRLWKYQVLALLDKGADAHTLDNQGNSLLHQSCETGEKLLDILQPYHVDVNLQCENGNTPLITTIGQEYRHIQRYGGNIGFKYYVEKLLSYGADVSIKNNFDRTAIQCASVWLGPTAYVRILLEEQRLLHEQNRMLAFAEGSHPRNHRSSYVSNLEPELFRMILELEDTRVRGGA